MGDLPTILRYLPPAETEEWTSNGSRALGDYVDAADHST
jgi:hypothetical protein